MEVAMNRLVSESASPATSPVGAQLPLNLVHEGETVHVLKLHGDKATRQHLIELGFVEGSQIKVITHSASGVIVNIKGANLGIDSNMARRITTY
ncbi:FeoA family protein [Olegusella massiliensis]|uniref:FeoA family protein n=1 Tax=Olegusella massiliensis TaxID=1776381 RepID=UPI0003AE6587|nr:FeoA family protein [Olegusella massiliensis]ERL12350.1 FeoA domain protein [Coriobacteriaceae bacterium BV3Ac1]